MSLGEVNRDPNLGRTVLDRIGMMLVWMVLALIVFNLVVAFVPPVNHYWVSHVGRLSDPRLDVWRCQ